MLVIRQIKQGFVKAVQQHHKHLLS